MKRPLVDVALDTALTSVKLVKRADAKSVPLAKEVASELTDVLRKKEVSELGNMRDTVATLTDFVARRPWVSLGVAGVLAIGFLAYRKKG